jgi:hypothetical protein
VTETNADWTYVYIFSATHSGKSVSPVKVGVSADVQRRFSQINTTACPYDLTVFSTFKFPVRGAAVCVEKAFHSVHQEQRLAREWFDMEPDYADRSLCTGVLFCMACDGVSYSRAIAWASWIAGRKIEIEEKDYLNIIAGARPILEVVRQ